MKGYAGEIEKVISDIPCNKLIEASNLYKSKLSNIPELTFYKTLERLQKENMILHLTKGIYYKPKKSKFGIVPISDNDIVNYYTKGNKGVLTGYQLYNQKGITTQIPKTVDVLTVAVQGERKSINNVRLEKIYLELNEKTRPTIETLELLRFYGKVEDINSRAFKDYMIKFSKVYDDDVAQYVLSNRKYKKATIAFLARILDALDVENSLDKHLSALSNYKIPMMEEIYEFAYR